MDNGRKHHTKNQAPQLISLQITPSTGTIIENKSLRYFGHHFQLNLDSTYNEKIGCPSSELQGNLANQLIPQLDLIPGCYLHKRFVRRYFKSSQSLRTVRVNHRALDVICLLDSAGFLESSQARASSPSNMSTNAGLAGPEIYLNTTTDKINSHRDRIRAAFIPHSYNIATAL